MLEKILGILQPEKSFDLVRRDMEIAGRPCTLLFVDGMIKDEVMEKMLEYFLKLGPNPGYAKLFPQNYPIRGGCR